MIYQPNFLNPNNLTIDATVAQTFTAKIQGSVCDAYQLKIYDMNNVLKYDSTKLALSPNLYQNDILFHNLIENSLTNGNQYKWTLTTFQGSSSATSREISFYCYSTPTLSMSIPTTITTKKYLFQATYTQAQSISINRWYMVFLDENNEIILQTPYSYSGNIQYTFDGFADAKTYSVYTVVENQMNVTIQSPIYDFTVDYSAPSLNIVPTATLLKDLSAIQIDWSSPIQINGAITGTSNYYNGLFNPNNTGLKLDDSSYIEFNVDIPIDFTAKVDYVPDPTFTSGIMIELQDDSGLFYQIGYDGSKFYYNNNGIIVYSIPKPLPSSVFLICVKGIEVLIIYNNQIYDHIKP